MHTITVTERYLGDGSSVFDVSLGRTDFHAASLKDATLFAEALEKIIDRHTVDKCRIEYNE